MTSTLTKTTVECYKIRIGYDYADITVDSNGKAGRIQIASAWGSWENYWGACGCPFKQFLVELSDDVHYTAGKFGAAKWFDQEATMLELRRQVSEHDNEEEKEAMEEELEVLEDCTEVNSFGHLAYESETLRKLWDCGPNIIYGISPGFLNFWKAVWPIFVEELKKELLNTENCKGVTIVQNTYPAVRPSKYGKYLVRRGDKTHFEVWNGTGWAYNENTITAWCEIPI